MFEGLNFGQPLIPLDKLGSKGYKLEKKIEFPIPKHLNTWNDSNLMTGDSFVSSFIISWIAP